MRLSTRSAAANTATIRPPAGRLPKRRPRSAINSAPSSRLNTPATQAAEYWPTLWPSTTSGSKPHDCQSRARPISTANKAGWAYAVCRSVSSALRATSRVAVSKMTSSNGFSSTSATASAHRFTVSANTGSVSNNSRAMPGYWLP